MTKTKEEYSPYCDKCGHCGFVECCGITDFLKKHVKGKTDCPNEREVLQDLITLVNYSLSKEMKQDYLHKCSKCKSNKCSGWHRVTPKKI